MKLLRATLDALRAGPLRRAGARGSADAALGRLEKQLGHRFAKPSLLSQALTHKSSIPPENASGPQTWLVCNERLEFLGDAVLNCLVTEFLYHRYPDKDEGLLSKMKSLLVSRKILGDLAADMGLGEYLILGYSESKTGGRTRMSVQSNAYEAVVGALYLDGGMDAALRFLKKTLFARVDEFLNDEANTNYKSAILEMAQRDGFGIPRYIVLDTSGPDHAKEFRIRVEVGGVALGEGIGSNKKIAQQRAAYQATLNYDKEKILSRSGGSAVQSRTPPGKP